MSYRKKTPPRPPKALKCYAIWCDDEGFLPESLSSTIKHTEDFVYGSSWVGLACDAVWEVEVRFVRQVRRVARLKEQRKP